MFNKIKNNIDTKNIFKILILVSSLFFGGCYSIQKYDVEKSMNNYNEFKNLEIPLYFDAGIYPFIYVTIEGQKMPLHIDIGNETGNFSLKNKSFESVKNKSIQKSNFSVGFDGLIKNNSYFNMSEIEIEKIKFNNVECKKSSSNLPDYLMDIGNIGFNFLREFNFKLDYKNKKLVLYKKEIIPDNISISWKKIILNKKPLLTFNGYIQGYNKKLQIGIDTGMVMIDKDVVKNLIRIPFESSFILNQKDSFLGNEKKLKVLNELSVINENIMIDNLDFLMYEIKQPDDRDIFLGGDFFFKYNTFFDNKNNILYIDKY